MNRRSATLKYEIPITKKYTESIIRKAKRFLSLNCVQKIDKNRFIVKPIKSYNKRLYLVTLDEKSKKWSCTCQYGKECSHILAVKLFNLKEEKI